MVELRLVRREPIAAFAMFVVAIACGSGMDRAAAAQVEVKGAGATFPAPLYERWGATYGRELDVRLEYQPVGSGEGIERIRRRTVDFGASDVPLPSSELAQGGLIQFPVVVGGVVPVVHIDGIQGAELKLTGAVVARIYLGEIRRWNDRAIAELNPGVALPGTNITVVHRSDSSGTSELWTAYLSSASAPWRAAVGTSMKPTWPVGVGGVGNEGVASYVERTRSSIGYVEYAYAVNHGLKAALLRNRDGHFVRAGPETFRGAIDAFDWGDAEGFRQIGPDQPGASSWPVAGVTFILLPKISSDGARARATVEFFDLALRNGGTIARELGYEPLPRAVADRIPALWRRELRDNLGRPVW